MGFQYVVDMEKSGTFQTDIDKCGLHARQNADNPAKIDVSCQSAGLRAFDMQFLGGTF